MSFISNICSFFSGHVTPVTLIAPAPSAVLAPVVPAPRADPAPAAPSIPGLEAALRAAAPGASAGIWIPALTGPMIAAGMTTPKRVSAFLGRCVAEAGNNFAELSENDNYTHADRLVVVFPREFANVAIAAPYVGNPEKIANRCYAGKLGNGDEASGDGWAFRGGGLLQLTGRNTITAFGKTIGMTAEAAAVFLRTPPGAAAGACWYWATRNLNNAADSWSLGLVTLKVNGTAMEGYAVATAASNAALAAMGGHA